MPTLRLTFDNGDTRSLRIAAEDKEKINDYIEKCLGTGAPMVFSFPHDKVFLPAGAADKTRFEILEDA